MPTRRVRGRFIVEVRYARKYESDIPEEDRRKVLLFIKSEYSHDAAVSIDDLLELRAAIDRFFLLGLWQQGP